MLLEIGLSNALMATILAVPAALATRFGRRPVLAHTLWLLVLLKLVTPPIFKVTAPDPMALVDVTAQASSPRPFLSEPEKRKLRPEEPAAPERDCAEWATESPSTACDAAPCEKEIIAAPEPLIMLTPLASGAAEPPAPRPAAEPAAVAAAAVIPAVATDWIAVAVVTWWCGALGCLALAAVRMGAFHRLLRYATPAPLDVQEQAERLAQQLGLRRCPRVWVVPGAVSPLVWAVAGRARIIVPRHLLERLGPQERETMLAHELAHVRRHDHWVRWLEFVVLAIFWWHPVAWLARWQIQQLEEQCCDGWVVATLPNAAREYARALVKTVHFLAEAQPALPPAASGLGYVHLLKRRLDMILTRSLSHRLPWPVQVAAVLFGLMVLPVAPQRLAAKAAAADDPPEVMALPVAPQRLAAKTATPDDPPEARAADDNDESSSSSNRRDLEKRMSSLEKKMDRLLRTLERSSSSRSSSRSSSESADEDKRKSDRDTERAETKRRTKEAKEATKSSRGRSWNPDDMKDFEVQMKDLDKRIRAAVEKAVNPDRMKEMERQIEEAVNKSVNPERMEEMSRQIEQAVRQAVNPERIEALVRRIEATVKHNVAAEHQRATAEHQAEEARRNAKEVREKADRDRVDSERRSRSSSRSSSRDGGTSDLERRMSRLEERMNRVLEALEAQRRPPK
jgi:beta-lactamase regulating signal transducer with metallopeptidase domain